MTTSTTPFTKAIRYDRKTRDFAYFLNGELVGYAPTYLEADRRLNEYAYKLLSSASFTSDPADVAADDVDEIAAITESPTNELETLRANAPSEKQGVCSVCGRKRTVYNTNAVLDWTADTLELAYTCGTCQHRRARRVNTKEMHGAGRRGY